MTTNEITPRDYYAGLAMQEYLRQYLSDDYAKYDQKHISIQSFETADAMLAERNKEATS